MDIKSIKEYLGQDWTMVQRHISDALKSDIDLLNVTNDSILSHAGKQLRPLLAVLLARACSGGTASEATYRYAAASELLHNATLLHDDVADDSDQRRGRPTIRSLMGPSVSVLVGDYWLVKAMELILGNHESDVKAIKVFARTLSDLAEGEMLQLQKAQSGDTDEDDYRRIIYSKTASLFVAACRSAVLSVSSDETYEAAAVSYAEYLGLAFQIQDDILDYCGTESVGKPLGVDILEQKITLPLLGALKNASSDEQAHIRSLVKDIPSHPEYRDEIVGFVREHGGLEYARTVLNSYVEEAVRALDAFPEREEKGILKDIAYFTAQRTM